MWHRPLRRLMQRFRSIQTYGTTHTKKRYRATKPKNSALIFAILHRCQRTMVGIAEIPGGVFFLVLFFDIKEKEHIKNFNSKSTFRRNHTAGRCGHRPLRRFLRQDSDPHGVPKQFHNHRKKGCSLMETAFRLILLSIL